MLKKLGKWYLYALIGFAIVAVIAALAGARDPDAVFKRAQKSHDLELMQKISGDYPDLSIDGKQASLIVKEILDKKAEEKRIKEAQEKAEADKIAKEKAEAVKKAKEEAEEKRIEEEKAKAKKIAEERIRKIKFNTTYSYVKKSKVAGLPNVVSMGYKVNIATKNGKLIITQTTNPTGFILKEIIRYTLNIKDIIDIAVNPPQLANSKTSGLINVNDTFSLTITTFNSTSIQVKRIFNYDYNKGEKTQDYKRGSTILLFNNKKTLSKIKDTLLKFNSDNISSTNYKEYSIPVTVKAKSGLCLHKYSAAGIEMHFKIGKENEINKLIQRKECFVNKKNINAYVVEKSKTDEIKLLLQNSKLDTYFVWVSKERIL